MGTTIHISKNVTEKEQSFIIIVGIGINGLINISRHCILNKSVGYDTRVLPAEKKSFQNRGHLSRIDVERKEIQTKQHMII